MITVVQAPAYCAVQDQGWRHLRRSGMPVSGAMDRQALNAANGLVGNPAEAAGLEWALTSGRLRFDHGTRVAICGPDQETTQTVEAGGEVELPRPATGRFLYLAVSGGVDVLPVLGSRSTYLPAGLGHLFKAGDRIPVGVTPAQPRGHLAAARPDYASGVVRVVEGPQRGLFSAAEWERFLSLQWKVSGASDRMGYRLEGSASLAAPVADLPSEAACVGAVQVPPDGKPIVLMADGPTVGGYPKIAVVISADLPVLAQRQPGAPVRFSVVSMREAQDALRQAQ